MSCLRFIHAADIHLGYQQSGSKEGALHGFCRGFLTIVEWAIEGQTDFGLLGGELARSTEQE
jgi:DNA repair exonuclease SbcCD nuclease subunit